MARMLQYERLQIDTTSRKDEPTPFPAFRKQKHLLERLETSEGRQAANCNRARIQRPYSDACIQASKKACVYTCGPFVCDDVLASVQCRSVGVCVRSPPRAEDAEHGACTLKFPEILRAFPIAAPVVAETSALIAHIVCFVFQVFCVRRELHFLFWTRSLLVSSYSPLCSRADEHASERESERASQRTSRDSTKRARRSKLLSHLHLEDKDGDSDGPPTGRASERAVRPLGWLAVRPAGRPPSANSIYIMFKLWKSSSATFTGHYTVRLASAEPSWTRQTRWQGSCTCCSGSYSDRKRSVNQRKAQTEQTCSNQ